MAWWHGAMHMMQWWMQRTKQITRRNPETLEGIWSSGLGALHIVQHWSSDTVQRWSSAVTILFGYIPTLELGSGPALVLGCKRHLECSPRLELGRKRTPPHGNNFKPEVWSKNNKPLLKAEDLKGLLGYPTCKLFRFTLAILKIKDEKISWTSFQDQRPKMNNSSEESRSTPTWRPVQGATDGVLDLGVPTMSSPDQLDRAEDPRGGSFMGQFGHCLPHTRKTPRDLAPNTRTLLKP